MQGNSISSRSLLYNANIREADQCPIMLPIATWYNTGLLRKCSRYGAENAKIRNCLAYEITPVYLTINWLAVSVNYQLKSHCHYQNMFITTL